MSPLAKYLVIKHGFALVLTIVWAGMIGFVLWLAELMVRESLELALVAGLPLGMLAIYLSVTYFRVVDYWLGEEEA
jgi:hypothetical protein